jgi:hypothetical protein
MALCKYGAMTDLFSLYLTAHVAAFLAFVHYRLLYTSIFQEMKVEDDETGRHHFDTCNGFWGRPGHGAPKSAVKKQKLDRLLYPQMVPISVH